MVIDDQEVTRTVYIFTFTERVVLRHRAEQMNQDIDIHVIELAWPSCVMLRQLIEEEDQVCNRRIRSVWPVLEVGAAARAIDHSKVLVD